MFSGLLSSISFVYFGPFWCILTNVLLYYKLPKLVELVSRKPNSMSGVHFELISCEGWGLKKELWIANNGNDDEEGNDDDEEEDGGMVYPKDLETPPLERLS